MADAEAICEAAQRPTMRIAVKSEAKQAAAAIFRTRDLLVCQRKQITNALRGHLGAEGQANAEAANESPRRVKNAQQPR